MRVRLGNSVAAGDWTEHGLAVGYDRTVMVYDVHLEGGRP
jgi:hypothetical protein